MFLSHKTCFVLLYDSLITCISSRLVYYIVLTLVGLCSLANSISQGHWFGARTKTTEKTIFKRYVAHVLLNSKLND
jgi:hypothetical protein